MKFTPYLLAAAAVAVVSGPAMAQVTKELTGETMTAKATVEAIDRSTRQVTLKNDDGTYEVLDVPESVKRFDTLKVGDKVTARYYENIVLRLKAPGEKDVDTATAAVTPVAGEKPKGTMATQRAITATITEIDQKAPSITFKGPNGWSYSTRVEDKKALAKVKVGDKVDITWTHAAIVAFDDAK
jgi:hypothetical protein